MNIEKPSFKRICLMHIQALTNFPYIEKDFDAITDYELICKVVDYLNQVIANTNDQNAAITDLYNAFIELKDYVDNYFDNNFPELVSDKLDEMAEDETLENLLNNRLKLITTYHTFTDVVEDKDTLVNGLIIKTLGYHTINDGGDATYYITNTASETDYQENFGNGLYATLISKELYIKQFGIEENDDISSTLSSLLNIYDKLKIKINTNVKLHDLEVSSTKELEIDFMDNEIEIKNRDASETIISNYGKLKLLNATFDAKSNNSVTVVRSYNESNIVIDNCSFINFKELDNTISTNIIWLYTGSKSKITNCHFENIKQLGNGVTTDGGGSATCIVSKNNDNIETTEPTICVIDKCNFKNNWNINSSGEPIIEDFDNIKLQNYLTGEDFEKRNMYIITNITSYNSGKRVIKAQTNNVTIDNIECTAENFDMYQVIALFHYNHNVNNVRGIVHHIPNALSLLGVSNANISNINIINDGESTEEVFRSSIQVTNSTNCNFDNIYLKGFSVGLAIWGNTENINFNNSIFDSYAKNLYVYTRTTDSANPASGVTVKNINFNNCNFITEAESSGQLYQVASNNTTNIMDYVSFNNCIFKVPKTLYRYGVFFTNCLNFKMVNCNFEINNTQDGIVSFATNAGISKLINCNFDYTNNTPLIRSNDTARLYLDKVNTNGKLDLQGTSKMLIQYCNYDSITGNTSTNCHIDTFDMS